MHVIQTQLVNYSYPGYVEKQVRLVRWWHLYEENGKELALPFTEEQEDILIKYMDDHPDNFPAGKREIFNSGNLILPFLQYENHESDTEKPCVLVIRAKSSEYISELCRRMDIVLQNDELPVRLPFDIVGEVLLEKA